MKYPIYSPIRFSALCIFWLASQANLTGQGWQYFQHPANLPKYVPKVAVDPGGKLWYASGSLLGQFDGANWQAHDFQAAGINVAYNALKSFAHAPDGSVWCGSQDRVLHYVPASDTWTLHNPSNSAVNLNGFDLLVDNNGHVLWSVGGGWYEWDGNAWARGYFWLNDQEGQGIEEYATRQIIQDNFGDYWNITAGSIQIETGFITPAGVIRRNATDTVVYKMGDLGYPDILGIPAAQNTQGYPLVVVAAADASGNRVLRLLSYEFGGWQTLGDSPATLASINEVFQDLVGNVWLAGNIGQTQPVVYRRLPDGTWKTYLLDAQQIGYLFSITGGPTGDIWAGGRLGTLGVLAKLPVQAISGLPAVQPPCAPIAVLQVGDVLEFQHVPEGAKLQGTAWDIQGWQVASFELSPDSRSIPIGSWPKGVHILSLRGDGACPTQPFKISRQ